MSHPCLRSMIILVCLGFTSYSPGQELDTDGDGLLDLIDVDRFDRFRSDAHSVGVFSGLSIEDLDGSSLLTNLQELWLGGNQISSIESGDFEGLTNLQGLSLSGNQITSIGRGDFEGLTNLQELWLGGNQISSIESGDFEGLTNLQGLWLSGNQITSIERGDFEGLTNLQELWLNDNQITSIERGDFEGLTNLQGLWLSGNQITSIERGDFEGLTNLQELWLNDNQITSIERGDFEGLTNLQGLWLNDNQISGLESGAFDGLTNLQHVLLHGNPGLTELNLSQATFDSLRVCHQPFFLIGFCIDSDRVKTVVLDDAQLSLNSFTVIGNATASITDISMDGLTFPSERSLSLLRSNLRSLLHTETLDNVTVDPYLYADFDSVFDDFAAIEGNTLTVASPDCDGNDVVSIADANCTSSRKLDRFFEAADTYRGDTDGIDGVDFNDFLRLSGNFGMSPAVYTDGDFDLDSEVGFTDYLILAGNFGLGFDFNTDTAVAVPEPSAIAMVMCIVLVLAGACKRD